MFQCSGEKKNNHRKTNDNTSLKSNGYLPRNGIIHEHDERNGFVGTPLSAPIWILSNLQID